MGHHVKLLAHGTSGRVENAGVGERSVYGWGLELAQPADTGNWVHFGIPTVQEERGTGLKTQAVTLSMRLNENARVAAVHLYHGKARISAQELDERGPEVNVEYNLPEVNVADALNVCVLVEFLPGDAGGKAVFYSTGVRCWQDS